MKQVSRWPFYLTIFLTPCSLFAQSGGPPMLTDDPGTPGEDNWEINTSFNMEVSSVTDYEAPLIDVNYGFKDRAQFKVEIPLLFSESENKKLTRSVGNPSMGVKFRFMDEGNNFLAASVYPQMLVSFSADKNEYKLPLQLEKHLGQFLIGQELGFLAGPDVSTFFEGTLTGYKFSRRFESMVEFYLQKDMHAEKSTRGFLNFGMRYVANRLSILASAGAQVETPGDEEPKQFFSYTGVQWRF